MSGSPTVTVKLDDGTGTYPTDISTRVRWVDGLSVSSYGRADESPAGQSASLSLVLDNADGGMTAGFVFGGGTFGGGGFGGVPLYPGQGIRVTATSGATTRDRFTGRVSTLSQGWRSPDYAVINLAAFDFLADLSRKPLRSLLEEEILSHSPSAYYRLSEAEGSTSAGDISGNQAAPLTIAGTGAAMTFGSGTGPGVDGLTAATFANGQYLGDAAVASGTPQASFAMGCWFNTSTMPAATAWLIHDDGAGISITGPGGTLAATGPTWSLFGATNVVDGLTHFVALTSDGSTARLWLDGVQVASTAAGVSTTSVYRSVGGNPASTTAGLTGTISHAAVWPTLAGADVLAIYTAGTSGTETSAARFTRIASYAGFTSVSTPGNSGQLMAAQATSGAAVADALNAVAAAEGGVFFVNGSGTLVLQGRNYRALKTAADLTLDNEYTAPDTTMTYDTQQLINKVTVTRTGGASQVVESTGSSDAYGIFATSLDLAVAADADALYAAQWLVASHDNPAIRMATATVDAFTAPTSIPTQPALILARDVGDHLTLSGLMASAWSGSGDVIIEGWTETITDSSWTLQMNLLPWSLFSAFILDDATYGVLDSATPIGY